MNLSTYLMNGEFRTRQLSSFQPVVDSLDHDVLYNQPTSVIAKFLSRFGKALTKELLNEDGVLYLASWLRESNLQHYLELNLNDPAVLDEFVKSPSAKEQLYLRAQPRGVVCHWVAGNVPTLAIFSLVQSILTKNVNILRVPQDTMEGVLRILKVLGSVQVEHEGRTLHGQDVLKTIAAVYYPSSDSRLNTSMSMIADCKVIWGGKEAVRDIIALPQREHCENIVFGPKYSFSVADEESMNEATCRRLALDVISFEQNACSSPHVLFVQTSNEATMEAARRVATKMAAAFQETSPKYPKQSNKYSAILNARGRYLLDPRKELIHSKELDWTILINKEIELEEPVGARTLFVKGVSSASELLPLITNKIQTVGVAFEEISDELQFCEQATRRGVARCVSIGTMNNYDAPWDGILYINRLVRWTAYRTTTVKEKTYA
ncbi:MAG: acyl-CoA reductase [Calditrichota bacterium]